MDCNTGKIINNYTFLILNTEYFKECVANKTYFLFKTRKNCSQIITAGLYNYVKIFE